MYSIMPPASYTGQLARNRNIKTHSSWSICQQEKVCFLFAVVRETTSAGSSKLDWSVRNANLKPWTASNSHLKDTHVSDHFTIIMSYKEAESLRAGFSWVAVTLSFSVSDGHCISSPVPIQATQEVLMWEFECDKRKGAENSAEARSFHWDYIT